MIKKEHKKVVREAIAKWINWRLGTLLGFNPPWHINGQRKFNPTLKEVIQDAIRRNEAKIQQFKALKKKVQCGEASKCEIIACMMEDEKGREALTKAMLFPLKK